MRILIALIGVFLIAFSSLQGQSYFVKLTPAGMAKRSELLQVPSVPGRLHKQARPLLHNIVNVPRQPAVLQKWLQIEIRSAQDKAYLQSLREQNLIEKIEPVGYFKVHSISNDSLVDRQWYLPLLGMPGAWQITTGDSSIIVGVIDTGVDYLHPDLAPNIWHNRAEWYGKPGVDDDGNGYVDDTIGWDFTDAPRFADGGDYLHPDPDPMDEFSGGHGTEVAGIIAAVRNNGRGISGIAPNVKIMVLRAGTASGYLEEDDVIRAMIYAQRNGARILNMSFGDRQVSALFHDVLHYLASKGMILVAAAGNDGSSDVYYPAGFQETVAVGASNKNDWLAGFSNYGDWLDVLAPGVDMLSTAPGNGYNTVNGTSFSAPVVSAIAALILSRHPEFNNEEVRTVLKGSARPLAMDHSKIGAGRVDARAALTVEKSGALQIIRPAPQTYIGGNRYPVVVTAYHPDLQFVQLEYGLGVNPNHWHPLAQSTYRFYRADTIAFLPLLSLPDTLLTLHLTMGLLNGKEIDLTRTVHIDRTPPVIVRFLSVPSYQGTQSMLLFSLQTDDPTTMKVSAMRPGDIEKREVLEQSTYSERHFFQITPQTLPEGSRLFLQFVNGAGFSCTKSITLTFPASVKLSPWQPLGQVLPRGYLLAKVTDLNNNGQKEIVMSKYRSGGTFGRVHIYEFTSGHFVDRWHTDHIFIPRDAGDVTGNGKKDLLLSLGSYSCLMEANTNDAFPARVIWQDSSFWAAALCDLDGDGKGEIVGYRDSLYQVLEWDGQAQFKMVATLPNPTTGENRLGVPFVTIGDFNGDGTQEIAYGDYDGDVIVYTCSGDNRFQLLSTGRAAQSDATDLLTMATGTVFTLTHTAEDENLESQWQRRYWSLQSFRNSAGAANLSASYLSGFYPYYPKKNFGSSLNYAEMDGADFLFVGLYPYLYLLRKADQTWQPVWVSEGFNSNTVLLADFNNDGTPECYFDDGKGIAAFSPQSVRRPLAPFNLQARSLDSLRIQLRWQGSAANGFYVYRGSSPGSLQILTHSKSNTFVDTSASCLGCRFYYRVTAVDSSSPFSESAPSNIDSAKTGHAPRLIAARQENATQIVLQFDQSMKTESFARPRVSLTKAGVTARSLTVMAPPNRLLATFPQSIPYREGEILTVENVFNSDGIPLNERFNRVPVSCDWGRTKPFVREMRIKTRRNVELTFNMPMDRSSVSDLSHYRLQPYGQVEKVIILDDACSQIELQLSAQSMAGGYGQKAYLIVTDLKSKTGVEMDRAQEISLIRAVNDLQHLVVYPQPVRPQNRQLIFAKLPQNTQIQIFALNGKRIRSFRKVNEAGGVIWDLRDENGRQVHSGIYFYRAEYRGKERIGKLVIVR